VKDVEAARQRLQQEEQVNEDEGLAKFSNFVIHNKDMATRGHLPKDMMEQGRYLAAQTVGDAWMCYPWEATYVSPFPHHVVMHSKTPQIGGRWRSWVSDIDEQGRHAASQASAQLLKNRNGALEVIPSLQSPCSTIKLT